MNKIYGFTRGEVIGIVSAFPAALSYSEDSVNSKLENIGKTRRFAVRGEVVKVKVNYPRLKPWASG